MTQVIKFRQRTNSEFGLSPKHAPNIEEILALARKVLMSDCHEAVDLLETHIRAVAHAVEAKERLSSLEGKLKALEEAARGLGYKVDGSESEKQGKRSDSLF